MKELFYRFFALVFNLAALFKTPSELTVALISPHNAAFNDSLGEIEKELRRRGGYKILHISHADFSSPAKALAFFTKKAAQLAGAKYVFLNDNFMPLGYLNFKDEVRVVQLWHAEGAFKKFGLDIPQPPAIRSREAAANKKLSYVICSSPDLVPIYSSAFGVEKSRVLPLGSPRADVLLNEPNPKALRADFEKKFPLCAGKKIVLYAPTFRDDPELDKTFLDLFDVEAFNRRFGQTHALFIRLHPQVHTARSFEGAQDVTDWQNVNELTLVADELITDYSSICMDFALLGKPCFFFAPDLESYTKNRAFYFDYASYVPGETAQNMGELLDKMEGERQDEKRADFCSFNLKNVDGNSLSRIMLTIMEK